MGGSSGRVAIGSCRVEDGVCEGIPNVETGKEMFVCGERLPLLRPDGRCSLRRETAVEMK